LACLLSMFCVQLPHTSNLPKQSSLCCTWQTLADEVAGLQVHLFVLIPVLISAALDFAASK